MLDLPGPLGTIFNLLLVVLGFGAIIFVHELGHFLAAKWAGIRVLAFSMGMGPVVLSYRKGIGWRKGSSESDYRALVQTGRDKQLGVSPTEYRLSALPLGGYVKMLGQEDLNPGAISDAPDSYQNRPVWKRMVVISAGVVMNLITAALLFIVVFMAGLQVQPPVIGAVAENSPATTATPIGRDDIPPGLQPEDRILEVNGHRTRAFTDVTTEIAMSGRHDTVRILVDRPGEGTIQFQVKPERDKSTGFLDLGIFAAQAPRVINPRSQPDRESVERFASLRGLSGMPLGGVLIEIDGNPVTRPDALAEAAEASNGGPFTASFAQADAATITLEVQPVRALQRGLIAAGDQFAGVEHVLGLRPLLRVDPSSAPAQVQQGLKPGDVFVRIADAEYPAYDAALVLIPALKGQDIEVEILRDGERLTLPVTVSRKGTIGFLPDSTVNTDAITARPVRIAPPSDDPAPAPTPAAALIERAGTRILSIGDQPIGTLRDIPGAIARATDDAFASGTVPDTFTLSVRVELPLPVQPDGVRPIESRSWTLSRADVEAVRSLGWELPGGMAYLALFEPDMVIDKADSPWGAVVMGLAKSRQTMNQTYLTFLRLFQGTVRIEHLKGPVGIAHLGTQVADRGFVWLLFFLALVSVNLAVINFLPLPIVDGGQFLMLAYEGIRRRPVPIGFQNAVTLAGLLLIGAVFLIVTFHDIKSLLGL
ncbi:MAG: hypothetical protein D6692_06570 [Planctomycetota bacterium]|nr:MAG: hypothetical protein D6692_06570 [Planctomycetota bacterium]